MIEAFKIGIVVSLVNQASGALALIGRDLAKTDEKAQQLRKSMQNISMLVAGGAAMTGIGVGLLKGIEKTYDSAKGYEQAFARFQALNLGAATNADADKFAQSSKVIGTSARELITTMTDLHTVLGKYDMAKSLTPYIAQMEFANKAVYDTGSKFDDKQALNLAKVIEMRGGFRSEAEMKAQADAMQHVMSGTQNRVGPSDMLAYLKTGGIAARLQDNRAFYYEMEPLIQEQGGNRVGTGLMSAYQNLVQGRTTNRAAAEMMKIGILDPKKVEYTTTGNIKRVMPGAVVGGDLVAADPLRFMQSVLLPAFEKAGIKGDKAILNEIGSIFTNRTAASLFSLVYQQQDKIAKNISIDEKAMGVSAIVDQAKKTPVGAEAQVAASWENLRTQMGLKILPIVVPALVKLADGLNGLASWAEQHPTMTKFIMTFAGGLGILSVALGGAALAAGGFLLLGTALGSVPIAIITGIGVGVAALGAALVSINWRGVWAGIKGAVSGIGDCYVRAFEDLKALWTSFTAWVKSLVPDWLKGNPTATPIQPKGHSIGAADPSSRRDTSIPTSRTNIHAAANLFPDGFFHWGAKSEGSIADSGTVAPSLLQALTPAKSPTSQTADQKLPSLPHTPAVVFAPTGSSRTSAPAAGQLPASPPPLGRPIRQTQTADKAAIATMTANIVQAIHDLGAQVAKMKFEVDGAQIGKVASTHQDRAANAPRQSASRFDPTAGYLPPGGYAPAR